MDESHMQTRVGNHFRRMEELIETSFLGTIVDIETIGEFGRVKGGVLPIGSDYLQRYREMKITAVGMLFAGKMVIHVANGVHSLDTFQKTAVQLVSESAEPRYAFNKAFEEGCYFWNSGHEFLEFDYELQRYPRERKESVVKSLNIDNYGDPFNGKGAKCKDAFLSDDLNGIMKHNRACLLKESQILAMRGAERLATKWLDLDRI